ncbi:EamA domain-containing membrane protein RarD [Palleronia marisminoris]|uniref:Riboflavin transporter n=1 Tax=Palleronia marisminoris TaxID=315423 RepID=A0A1Y5RFD3_9RHOB|nr:DMT family transporter [Palleronia marisminoris]SFG16053.1 EamA domain-containing membrane protein RarD [Palleronia marisminoris]SLN15834.1 Riboflavin transporter [Palleronia marisminoris]
MKPLAGFFWMVVTGFLFVGVTATVKHLGGRVPAAEAAFLRYLLGLVFLLPLLGAIRRARLDKRRLGLFALRGAIHAVGVILWFFAMTRIPIAEVTALNYLSPVYITILAAVFLNEKFSWARGGAIAAALIGVVLILRPGFREVGPGHLAMMGTALLFACSYMIAKVMSDEVAPAVVVAMLSVWTTLGLAPAAIAVWVWPTWDELGWLFLVATLATTGHLTMTLAFKSAPISVTQPVTFLQLVWATILGWAVFGEGVDAFVLAGGTIIVGSVVIISIREARRRPKTPPVAP